MIFGALDVAGIGAFASRGGDRLSLFVGLDRQIFVGSVAVLRGGVPCRAIGQTVKVRLLELRIAATTRCVITINPSTSNSLSAGAMASG